MANSRCKWCGGEIFWIRASSGTPLPVDRRMRIGGNIAQRDGRWKFITPDGAIHYGSHRETCTREADRIRANQEKQRERVRAQIQQENERREAARIEALRGKTLDLFRGIS